VLEEAEVGVLIEPAEPRIGAAGDAGEGPGTGPAVVAPPNAPGLAFSLVTAAGRTSLGSTFLTAEPDPAAYLEAIRRRGARYVPALADAPARRIRVCARPLALDGRPLLGAVPGLDGVFVATGHGPWGISTGPASARLIADLVLGRRPEIPAAFDPARFGGVGPAVGTVRSPR
jgi:glycine/D-amino acid oxidase-like deaminating enzyme